MISYKFDIPEFVDSVKSNSDFWGLLKIIDKEICEAEQMRMPGSHNAFKEKEQRRKEYIRELKGFRFFLTSSIRPSNTYNFGAFRPVCQNLIDKNILDPTVIDAFTNKTP